VTLVVTDASSQGQLDANRALDVQVRVEVGIELSYTQTELDGPITDATYTEGQLVGVALFPGMVATAGDVDTNMSATVILDPA